MSETGFINLFILFLLFLFLTMLFYIFISFVKDISASEIENNANKIKPLQLKRMNYLEENKVFYENSAWVGIFVFTFFNGYFFIKLSWNFVFLQNLYLPIPALNNYILLLLWFFIIIISIILILVFIFFIPKRLSKKINFITKVRFLSFIMIISVIIKPITYISGFITKGILLLFGIKKNQEESMTEEEIISIVNEGQEQGVIEASEAEMIQNIFELGDKEARDIMTNRNNIIAIDSDMTLPDAIEFMTLENNSRFPVYEENLDHIIGIITLKDAVRFQTVSKKAKGALKNYPGILREAVFVPETKNIDDLFKEMQSGKLQMVIVSDEYGQTAGLIAMEDILEEIVGNIMDEYDEEEEYIEERGANIYETDGLTPLKELEEELGIQFESEEFDTINGFMISKLQHIPAENEHFELDFKGYRFEILEVENRIIKTVLVTKHK